MQLVWEQVAQKTGAVRIVFAPSEIVIGIKRFAVLDFRPEPHFPVDVVRSSPLLNGVVPFTFGSIAHVGPLAHHRRADAAFANQGGSLVPLQIRATLRTNLENFSSALASVVNLERLTQVTGHGLFHIDVLAGIHSIHRNRGVPMIDSRAADNIDIISLEQLSVVAEANALAADILLSILGAMLRNIGNRGENHVVLLSVLLHGTNMRHALSAHADKANGDTIICTNHTARGGRLVLAVNGGLE